MSPLLEIDGRRTMQDESGAEPTANSADHDDDPRSPPSPRVTFAGGPCWHTLAHRGAWSAALRLGHLALEWTISCGCSSAHPAADAMPRDAPAACPLDYEDAAQRDGFQLRVRVSDGLHDATSSIFVQLVDENDHPPDIVGPAEVRIFEDVPRNTIVARFNVSDRDANDHAR
ncbi:hypothetical protein OESDEN_06741 [Oesophagostomum dentatum]|uniref:Cadherin domain-containing protein n=1 Tax=Oesophagostomum dentatum TaxID=61180 RepID=A0A0B1T7X1_OESDE|nr:hypothetical protein OESDEN_06741 [Oesophagostomum dentatum]